MWQEKTISPEAVRVLSVLGQRSVLAPFYLAGGTGLALRLGHRRSVDLDFFAPESFNEDILVQKAQNAAGFSLVQKGPGTVHANVGGTKVSFLAYDYPLLFPCESFMKVQVADPRDIACMKLSAIAGRGSKRDFVDLYAVAQDHGLAQILAWFKQKFAAANYNLVHVLKSLAYFDDAEKDPPPDMLAPMPWDEVKGFFLREVPPLLEQDISG